MTKKSKIKKMIEADEREKRKEDGYYDGRFRTKVVPDKKKKEKRKRKRFASKSEQEQENG